MPVASLEGLLTRILEFDPNRTPESMVNDVDTILGPKFASIRGELVPAAHVGRLIGIAHWLQVVTVEEEEADARSKDILSAVAQVPSPGSIADLLNGLGFTRLNNRIQNRVLSHYVVQIEQAIKFDEAEGASTKLKSLLGDLN